MYLNSNLYQNGKTHHHSPSLNILEPIVKSPSPQSESTHLEVLLPKPLKLWRLPNWKSSTPRPEPITSFVHGPITEVWVHTPCGLLSVPLLEKIFASMEKLNTAAWAYFLFAHSKWTQLPKSGSTPLVVLLIVPPEPQWIDSKTTVRVYAPRQSYQCQ